MPATDVIETINCEQLATATDRLLLRGGRLSKHRPRARASTRSLTPPALGSYLHFARGSQPRIAAPAPAPRPRGRATDRRAERTLAMRRPAVYPQLFAITLAVPTLVGLAIGLVALL